MQPDVDAFKAKTAALNNDFVNDVTKRYLQVLYSQAAAFNTMAKFSKPAQPQFMFKVFQEASEHVETVKRDRKSPLNHVNCISEAILMFQFGAFLNTGALCENLPELYEQIKYPGNKILLTKVEQDIDWLNALLKLASSIKAFVLEQCNKVLVWSGKEDSAGAEAYFAGLTIPDKLDGFSSAPGAGTAAASSTPAPSAPAQSASGSDAVAGEFAASVASLVADLKAKAGALENASATKVTESIEEAINLTTALLKTMATHKKPADLAFCTTACKFGQMNDEAEDLFKSDRKSPVNVMKVAQAGA